MNEMKYNVFKLTDDLLYVIPCSNKLKDNSFRISKKEWGIMQRKKKLKKLSLI